MNKYTGNPEEERFTKPDPAEYDHLIVADGALGELEEWLEDGT